MIQTKRFFLPLAAALLLFSSCDNTVDLTADYKETMIIYGMLNQNQDTQIVRVNKAYLGDGNALLFAGIADSLNYNNLDVIIEKFAVGSTTPMATYTLSKSVNLVPKDSGLFASDQNVLYIMNTPLETGRQYKLTVTNPVTGYAATSTTLLANAPIMKYPLSSSTVMNFEQSLITVPNPTTRVTWLPATNAAVYQLVMTVRYSEYPVGNPGAAVGKQFDIRFPLIAADVSQTTNNEVGQGITKNDFFSFFVNNIPVTDNMIRNFIGLDFHVYVGGSAFYEYYKINQPSSSIVQKLLTYTNISNGLGLFSARTSGGLNGLQVNTKTLDSLKYGQFTSNLNFQ